MDGAGEGDSNKKSMNAEQGGLRRRAFFIAGTSLVSTFPFWTGMAAPPEHDPDEGVTAPEDLMKEHGVLNRCLLIYEEGMRRIREREEVDPGMFQQTAELVQRFVEQYHEQKLGERMEEDEKKVLGDEGFERSVEAVAGIEKQLGIYDLPQFTPVV